MKRAMVNQRHSCGDGCGCGRNGGGGRDLSTAVAGLNAAVERRRTQLATMDKTRREQEPVVVGAYVDPSGELVKVVREGPAGERQLAAPVPYWQSQNVQDSDEQTKVWIAGGGPAQRLRDQLNALMRIVDHPQSHEAERADARARASVIEAQLEVLRAGFRAGTHDPYGNKL